MTDLQKTIEELKKLHEKATQADHITAAGAGEKYECYACPEDSEAPIIADYFRRADAEFDLAFRNAFPAIVEALESRWIPVGERLPGDGVEVLLSCRQGQHIWMTVGFRVKADWHGHDAIDVTHWQSLPSPPLAPKASEA